MGRTLPVRVLTTKRHCAVPPPRTVGAAVKVTDRLLVRLDLSRGNPLLHWPGLRGDRIGIDRRPPHPSLPARRSQRADGGGAAKAQDLEVVAALRGRPTTRIGAPGRRGGP